MSDEARDIWTSMCISRRTKERLAEFAERLYRLHILGQGTPLPDAQLDRTDGKVSFDFAVNVLLDRVASHDARRQNSRQRVRKVAGAGDRPSDAKSESRP